MPDYRSMFDQRFVGSWDLDAKDVHVQIVKVEAQTLKNARGENRKPVVFFKGTEKGLVCNKTNSKTIAGMYGTKTENWIGKWITLYATQTSAGGETVDCIRIRPQPPRGKSAPAQPASATPQEDHGADVGGES